MSFFVNYFFRNHTGDNTIVKKSYPTQVSTIRGASRAAAVQGPELRDKESAPYLLKLETETDQFGKENSYYRLVGVQDFKFPIYVRTTALGNRDGKGNNIPEFPMSHTGEADSYVSLFSQNFLKTSKTNQIAKQNLSNPKYGFLHFYMV